MFFPDLIPWDKILRYVVIGVLAWFCITTVLAKMERAQEEKTEALLDRQITETELSLSKAESHELRMQIDYAQQAEKNALVERDRIQKAFDVAQAQIDQIRLERVAQSKPRTLTRLVNAATEKKLAKVREQHADLQSVVRDRL